MSCGGGSGGGSAGRLPVPSSVLGMFSESAAPTGGSSSSDDPEAHGGRTRSFPHQTNSWASYIYVQYPQTLDFSDFVDECVECVKQHTGHKLVAFNDFHVTLSRTISIPFHWIDTLKDSISTKVKTVKRFQAYLDTFHCYTNDDSTRTFLAIRVLDLSNHFHELVERCNKCLQDLNLPPFHEVPSFHISIAWCVGDITLETNDNKLLLTSLSNILSETLELQFISKQFAVTNVCFKSGNKLFTNILT